MASRPGDIPIPLAHPWTWAIPLFCLSAGGVLWLGGWNETLFLALNHLTSLGAHPLWAGLTILGDTLVALSLLGLFAGRRPDIVWAALIAALFAVLWVHGLKPLFDTPRPAAVLDPGQITIIGRTLTATAFPSGHSATAFTLAGTIILLRGVSMPWALLLLLMAILAALSRVMVGAHWPLDILGGMLGGWLAAVIGVWLGARWTWGLRPNPARALQIILLACAVSLLGVYDTGYPQAFPLQIAIGLICLIHGLKVLWQLRLTHGPGP
jgi:membrane-associated phospholipid phosphatase